MQYTTTSMTSHLFLSLMGTFCQDAGDFADLLFVEGCQNRKWNQKERKVY